MRVDQVELEVTEEELLAEAGLPPPGLPGFLRRLARFALIDIPDPICLLRAHGIVLFIGCSPEILAVYYPPVTMKATRW
jgi:hypothetical protein